MATYPTDGGSPGLWGAECRAYHAVSTDLATGKIKDGALQVSDAPPALGSAEVANAKYVDDSVTGQIAGNADYITKAYASIAGTTLNAQRNVVDDVSNPSTGIYVVNWSTNFSSVNYVVVVTVIGSTIPTTVRQSTKAEDSIILVFENSTTGANVDVAGFDLMAIGVQ